MKMHDTRGAAPHPYRILVADDDPSHRILVREILAEPKFVVVEAHDGMQAWEALHECAFDAVLLDINMPGMDGNEVCRRLRDRLSVTLLPVIMVSGTAVTEELITAMQGGATDFIRKPYAPAELLARVEAAASRKRLTDQLDSAESVLFTLARFVEAKDGNTGDHCSRLARNGMLFGEMLGLGRDELLALRRGGVLHDIGKLAVPDHVLLKPGPLNDAEWEIMRRHPVIGAELVSALPSMRLTVPIIRSHHERWDGTGYPDRLRGERIPLLARVFQILDIFDALRHARPYKPGMPLEAVLQQLQREADEGRCDPYLMGIFLDLVQAQADAFDAPVEEDLGAELFHRIERQGALAWLVSQMAAEAKYGIAS